MEHIRMQWVCLCVCFVFVESLLFADAVSDIDISDTHPAINCVNCSYWVCGRFSHFWLTEGLILHAVTPNLNPIGVTYAILNAIAPQQPTSSAIVGCFMIGLWFQFKWFAHTVVPFCFLGPYYPNFQSPLADLVAKLNYTSNMNTIKWYTDLLCHHAKCGGAGTSHAARQGGGQNLWCFFCVFCPLPVWMVRVLQTSSLSSWRTIVKKQFRYHWIAKVCSCSFSP